MKRITTFLLLFFIIFNTIAQQTTDSTLFDRNFRFNDGIFLSFNDVKSNSPIPKSNIITSVDKNLFNFYDLLFDQKNFTVIMLDGTEETFKPSQIWGYSSEGHLYINYNGYFSLVPVLGAICHFIATEEVFDNYSGGYYDQYYSTGSHIQTFQAIIDFTTGQLNYFTTQNIEPIFARDTILYKEWSELSKNKKRKLIFVYLQKFNERNHVYLPTN